MSGRVRTRENKSGEHIAYSESAIRHNASAIEYCRTSMAALSGSTAGKYSQFPLSDWTECNRNVVFNRCCFCNMQESSVSPESTASYSIWLPFLAYGCCCCWKPEQAGRSISSIGRAFSHTDFSVACAPMCSSGRFCMAWCTCIKPTNTN